MLRDELRQIIEQLDDFHARLVLSFIKKLLCL